MLFIFNKRDDHRQLNHDHISKLHKKNVEIPSGAIGADENIFDNSQYTVLIRGKITNIFDRKILFVSDQIQTIIECYEKYGQEMSEQLDGLFLIFLYDKKKQTAFIFNNRYQTTTLYYFENENLFLASPSVEIILKTVNAKLPAHTGSIRSFISNGFTMTDQTQISGIKKLLPSFFIKIEKGVISLQNHWNKEFSFERKKILDIEKHLDEYEALFQDGIDRFISHHQTGSLGTHLSGGHDTSFVLIQGSKVFKKPIHCFTATFPGWVFDEGSLAQNIAHKFSGIYHDVPFTASDLDYIVDLVRANEEPAVGSSLPLHKVALESKKYVDTMLSGDGGDTLWGEYYPVAEYHRYIKSMPLPIRKLFHQLSKFLVTLTDWERFWELEHVAALFTKENYYDDFMRTLCTYRHFSDELQNEIFTKDFINAAPIARSILEIVFNKENFSNALIEGKLFNAFYTYQNFHSTKSMNYLGINFYLPTINKKVMQFITSLPYDYVNGGNTFQRLTNNKKINRRFHKMALTRYLKPSEIYNRSFDIPWTKILTKRPEVLTKLQKRLKERGWFNEKTIDRLFDEFYQQKVKNHEILELKNHGYRIYTLLNLEIWAMEYLDGRLTNTKGQKVCLEDYLS